MKKLLQDLREWEGKTYDYLLETYPPGKFPNQPPLMWFVIINFTSLRGLPSSHFFEEAMNWHKRKKWFWRRKVLIFNPIW